MSRLLILASLSIPAIAAGCAVHEVHKDQDRIRCALLDLYTDQIMDNLIRASKGLPIIQLDYTNAGSTVTVAENSSFNAGQSVTNSRVRVLPAAALTLTRTILTSFGGSGAASNSNQIAITASPVITSNEVYDAYLEFLTLPGSLVVSCEPPEEGVAHLVKQTKKNKYYWVPVEYKFQFLRLALATTAQRGKALLAPDEFYAVTLKEIVKSEADKIHPDIKLLTVKIDKKIPNDTGYLTFDVDKKTYKLEVAEYDPDNAQRLSTTDHIVVFFDPDKVPPGMKTVDDFKLPLAVKVYLRHNRPQGPTTNDILDKIQFQVEQIRLNQLREGQL